MIKKLHGASSTLVANPRRKKRNPKRKAHGRKARAHKRKHSLHLKANPLRKRVKRQNPRKHAKHKRHNPLRRHKRRNPAMLEIAGVDVGSMAIGSIGAIAVTSALQGFVESQDFYKNATGAAKDYHLYDAIAPAAVAAGAAYAYKKMSGQGKEIAKYAFIGSVFIAIENVIGAKVKDATKDLLSGKSSAPSVTYSSTKAGTAKDASDASKGVWKSGDTGPDGKTIQGLYLDTVTGKRAVGGMYMPVSGGMSGMYMPTSGSAAGSVQADMGGLGLFKGKSLYGA